MEKLNLEEYMARMAGLVNSSLAGLLAPENEYPQSLHKAMHYSLFAGGKRVRPVLVLAACEAVGGRLEDALNTACAIECVHTYSLIHDDLPAIDNDDMRRGRPTCHKVYGEATAILAGDALLTVAFELIARSTLKDRGVLLDVTLELARAAGSSGMIGGQMVDIDSEGKDVTFPVLEYIHIHKTGELILASLRSGALIGGADEAGLRALDSYGKAVGLAFQIADDILDVEGSSAEMGKPTGGDELKGKATYPSMLGLDQARARARELVDIAINALSGLDSRAEPLRAIARYIVKRSR